MSWCCVFFEITLVYSMFIYSQHSGHLWSPEGEIVATGYSGYGNAKNNPEMEASKNLGPIPRGVYKFGEVYNSLRVGAFSIPLKPFKHDAHGRTAFVMHGDSRRNPGNASRGCIILPRAVREFVYENKQHLLVVIE